MPNCERCNRDTMFSRRFRCGRCERLVCSKCCTRGGTGQTGAHRWAYCFECQEEREKNLTNPPKGS